MAGAQNGHVLPAKQPSAHTGGPRRERHVPARARKHGARLAMLANTAPHRRRGAPQCPLTVSSKLEGFVWKRREASQDLKEPLTMLVILLILLPLYERKLV